VLAGNLLAAAGYKNVQNMWEGFKGNLKVNITGDTVDLDGDGIVSDDPYSGDLDGWANFAGLPVDDEIEPELIYSDYAYIYYTYEPLGGER
ncbi:MAG: hypothetical protein P8Z31_11410, partial [Gammaproteobacteria bacterium]